MNPHYQSINTSSRIPSYLQDKGEYEGSKNMFYGVRTTPSTMIDRCKTRNNDNNHSRVLLVVEEDDTHCHSDQRSDHNSNRASFETLLPKNGFYDLDAFFDSDIISLNDSILEEDQNLGEDEFLDDSLSRADIALPNLQTPSKLLLPCEENKEKISFVSSSQGKVLNTSAFDSLKRKAVSAFENKKEKETPPAKMIKIRTSPIQAWKKHSKSDDSVTTKRVVDRICFISNEDKVQISDETKQHGTSLSNEIFQHYKVAKFQESDTGCKRDQLETGYAGLACAYCDGSLGGRRIGGRYFPSSIKTMADPNKILLSMHKHLQKCSECPSSTKKHLAALHEVYDEERSIQPRGSQRKFYKGIWDFLRKKDNVSKFENKCKSSAPTDSLI